MAEQNSPKIFNTFADFRAEQEFSDSKTMVIVDGNSKIYYANYPFIRLFGFGEGHSLFDIESEPNIVYLIEAIAKSNYSSLHFELFLSSNNSVHGNYSVDIEKILIKEQEFFLLIISSLEEKTRIESKINNLNDALEYGNVPVIITDGSGYITYCTKSFEEILNKGIEDLYGMPLAKALSAYILEEDISELVDALDGSKKWRKRIEKTDKFGELVFKELQLSPVLKESSNSRSYILIAHDITDYVLKQRIMQKSEERQKSIINNISDLLLIIRTEKDRYVFENANDNFCQTFSVDKNKALFHRINEIFTTDFLSVVLSSIETIIYGSLSTAEFKYANKSIGRVYAGNISYTEDKYEEERIYIISLKDITQQLLYEEQLKKTLEKETQLNKLKSIFIENMSHELRTPYNALLGYSEILKDEISEGTVESAMEIVDSLKDVFGRVLSLFSNIIEVSQIESGEITFSKVRMNCNKILSSVYNQYLEKANEKKLGFSLLLEEKEFLVEVDWMKLEKIIEVLVDNAVKYTESGEIRLSTKTSDENLIIEVQDTGIGMDEAEVERLLEPFNQQEDVYTRSYQGAGLGLTIAHKLTRLMGGGFKIVSQCNNGTAVQLIFPICGDQL